MGRGKNHDWTSYFLHKRVKNSDTEQKHLREGAINQLSLSFLSLSPLCVTPEAPLGNF